MRGGAGTPDDPYVIRNWWIVPTASSGVRLSGTSAHVVLEDLYIDPRGPGNNVNSLDCHLRLSCTPAGIELIGAANVTVRRVHVPPLATSLVFDELGQGLFVPTGGNGLLALHSRDLVIADSVFGSKELTLNLGLGFENVEHVNVRNVTVIRTNTPFATFGLSHVTVERSTFEGFPWNWMGLGGQVSHVTFARNVFERAHFRLDEPAHNISFVDNTFNVSWNAFVADARVTDLTVCGNRVLGAVQPNGAFDLSAGVERGAIRHNTFLDGRVAIEVGPSIDLRVEANRVVGGVHGLPSLLLATPASIHGNSFEELPSGVEITRPADARGNWWGAPDGPSGDAPGSGVRLRTRGASVLIDPFLTSPPVIPDSCHGDDQPRGSLGTPLPHGTVRLRSP